MGSVNINTFMKSKAYTEPSVKDAAKQNYCNEFSKVINKKLGEERNNTKTAAEHRVSEKSNLAEDPNLKGDKVDAAVKTEEPKIEENANEQLMLLIQLLMSFEDKAGAQDADKLKQSISELLLGSISGENKDNNKNNS